MRMKFLLLSILVPILLQGQITTPVIKARFGVDGDLRSNFFNSSIQSSNDDWFNMLSADTTGKFIIDTTGAAAIIAGYQSDISPFPRRSASFYRTMNRPSYSVVNNRLWLDAIWVRDYHGTDTTAFISGSDKNGMSPANWSGGVQGVPDKNDILDVMIHLRRAGPTSADSLWFFGGISVDNTTGNRYFDMEMYQTDIYYDRPSHKWYGYGPDLGHTSWTFDAAGVVVKPGDIIFSAEFQNSALTNVEARIWVSRTVWQTVVPANFMWGGQFDGGSAGSAYGYASILPKSDGAFYTGIGCANNTWPGNFQLVLQNNTVTNSMIKDQFMELSVNLTKLGLDPVANINGDICGSPFSRIVVKSRTSSAFTSELKDFVAPTDFFLAARVQVETATPRICYENSTANIYVINPVATSIYQWFTTNGHIVGATNGTSIVVDTPGVYIVKQYLQNGCSEYATDTIEVLPLIDCIPLDKNLGSLNGMLEDRTTRLNWKVLTNSEVSYFEIEESTDGRNFSFLGRVNATTAPNEQYYQFSSNMQQPLMYYRIKMIVKSGRFEYTNIIRLQKSGQQEQVPNFLPNPTLDKVRMEWNATEAGPAQVTVTDMNGRFISKSRIEISKGFNTINVADLTTQPAGIYQVQVIISGKSFSRKLILVH